MKNIVKRRKFTVELLFSRLTELLPTKKPCFKHSVFHTGRTTRLLKVPSTTKTLFGGTNGFVCF
jgi:hypothetical protein